MYGASYYGKIDYGTSNAFDTFTLINLELTVVTSTLNKKTSRRFSESVTIISIITKTTRKVFNLSVSVIDTISKWLNTQVNRWTKINRP